MAVGEFVDYAPGPERGSYSFARGDGSQLLATGPQAEALAQMLDRQKAVAPQPVAQAAPQQQGGFGGQVNNAWASDAPAPNPAAPPAPPAGPVPVPAREGPPVSIARPQAPPGPQWEPVARTRTGTIVRDARTGQLAEMQHGSAGVSAGQLARQAGQAVAMPSGMAESRSGGFEHNQDYVDQLANAAIDQKLALDRLGQAKREEAIAEQGVFRQQQAQQAGFVKQQQDAAAEADALHRNDMARLDRAQGDARAAKVDSNRLFSGSGGTMRTIGAAIAASLGALGAGLARTPNFAQDIISRAIDRDVADQERELANKRGDADNALRRWMQSGADLKQAKAGVRIEQLEAARQKMGEIAAKAKLDATGGTVGAQMAGIDQQLAKEVEEYRIRSQGQRTQEVTARYAYPQGGSRGGLVPLTLEQQASIGNIDATQRRVVVDESRAAATAAGGGKLGQRQIGQVAAARNARSIITEIAEAYGLKKKNGQWQDPSGGAAFAGGTPYTDTQQKVDALKLSFAGEIGKAQTGGVPGVEELNHLNKQFEGANTPGKIGALLRHYDRMMQEVEHNVRSVAAGGVEGTPQDDEESLGAQERGAD